MPVKLFPYATTYAPNAGTTAPPQKMQFTETPQEKPEPLQRTKSPDIGRQFARLMQDLIGFVKGAWPQVATTFMAIAGVSIGKRLLFSPKTT